VEKKKILLIHHDASIADLLRRILEEDAFIIVEQDPFRVMALVSGSHFDIVLLDVGLLGSKGADVIKRLKGEDPGTTVLALTPSSKDKEVEALRAGADFVSGRENGIEEAIFLTRFALYGKHFQKTLGSFPLKPLYNIARAGLVGRRQRPFLKFSLCTVIAQVHGDGGSLMLIDKQGSELHLAAAYGMEEELRGLARKKLGEKIAGWVAEKKEGVILEGKLTSDPRFSGFSKEKRTIVSAISVPLIAEGKGMGTMNINAFPPSEVFNRDDLDVLMLMGQEIGDGLLRIREVEMLESERTEPLKDMARLFSDKVNNPLTVMYIGLNELLRHGGFGEGDERREILNDCLTAAGRIRGIIAGLKKVGRKP